MEVLEIDKSQAKKLQKRSEDFQGEFADDMAALYEKYEKRLPDELTPDQRSKAKSLLGKTPSHLFMIPKK